MPLESKLDRRDAGVKALGKERASLHLTLMPSASALRPFRPEGRHVLAVHARLLTGK